jgi:hypothetical protein
MKARTNTSPPGAKADRAPRRPVRPPSQEASASGPRRLLRLAASVLLGATILGACGPDETRSEEEACVFLDYFPDGVCGSPADALRVNPTSFICNANDSLCRVENVRGPFPRVLELGGDFCCYNFTLVRTDDGRRGL